MNPKDEREKEITKESLSENNSVFVYEQYDF